MTRIRAIAAALSLAFAIPAAAQTATSPGGGTVGSATLRNGYPAGGGAFALPSQAASPGISGSLASPGGTASNSTGAGATTAPTGGGSNPTGTATATGSAGGGGVATARNQDGRLQLFHRTSTNSVATAYATLLPTADIGTSLVISMPSYDVNLFLDGMIQAANGQPLAGLVNAIGRPIAADVGITTFASGFELITIINSLETIFTGTPNPGLGNTFPKLP